MSSLQANKENIKILWFFFRNHKIRMSIVLAAMVASGILESLNLAALYPIINHGLDIENQNSALKFLDSMVIFFGKEDLFLSSCILLIVITIFATLFKVTYHFLSNLLIKQIVSENQKAIFDRYIQAKYKYFVKSQQGKLIYAGTTAPLGVSNNMFLTLRLLSSIVTTAFFVALMTMLAWQGMAFIIFLGFFYVAFVRKIIRRIVNKYAHLTVDEDRKKNVILNEYITGVKSIKAFFRYDYWKEKYKSAVERSVLFNFKVMMGRVLPDSFLKFIFFVSFALIGIVLNVRLGGEILPLLPILGTFAGVVSRLIPYINLIGTDIVGIARFMPDTKIVYDTLNEETEKVRDGSIAVKEFKNKVAFDHVSFKYEGMEDFLLSDLSFSIQKRKVTAIVGSSGSGKSTIVNLLLRLYDSQDGSIRLDDTDIEEYKTGDYLSLFGYVSQETFIFNGTIRDNIAFGDLTVSDEQIVEAAKLANADEFIIKTEQGYETIVGDAGMKLSGGQRQRIAIARAMLRHPQIIILDEATSSLDNISERAVQDAINRISENTTVLIIAHRLSTVQNADKIIVLENGAIAEEGTHEALIEKKNTYFQLYTS